MQQTGLLGLAALATLAAASPLSHNVVRDGPMGMGMSGMPMGMGMGMATVAKNPVMKTIAPLFNSAENPTKRVQIRYGPFTMPAANDTSVMPMPGMEDEGGVVDVSWAIGEPVKPCSNCVLKQGQMTLTYTDGSLANLDSGAWLHHVTLATVGPNRRDYACPNVEKQGMGIIGGDHERFMVVHNDRNETFWGANGADQAGYYLGGDADKLAMILELKNELNVPKDVYLVQEFEYLPGELPKGWLDVKGLWLDAAKCGVMSSEIEAPSANEGFELASEPWIATEDAKFLTTVAHTHDGAIATEILVNDKPACVMVAEYGHDPAYIPTKAAIAMGAQDIDHIRRYTPCVDFGSIKKGDKLQLRAKYDFEHIASATGRSGKPVGVMGIALTFVGVPKA